MAQLSLNFNTVTALGPNDPDDGDAGRQLRGMAIAATVRIQKVKVGYQVPSQSGNGSYIVNTDEAPYCSCPDFERRQSACKHVYAVEFTIQREELADGTVVETRTTRVTYRQDWAAYNGAQEHEQEYFLRLLRELCDTIEEPPAKATGRPRMPLSDAVFAAGLKVYSTMSGRRAMTDIRNAHADGLLASAPSTAAVWRCMEDASLYPVLVGLIERSALPLASVESDFAVDSTGFATSVYHRWFDHKWNKLIREAQWVKGHAMCGVKTNIITTCAVTAGESADSPYLAPFVKTTARGFHVSEVSADKAYLAKNNFRAVNAVGGMAYIPFKSNSKAITHHKRDALWERMYHFFKYNEREYMAHYNKRSNVETTFHMVKAKFGASVRSKAPEAQVNEVLLKFLCHNIAVLIQSTYELRITPIFNEQARMDALG